jgi:amino acid permease
VTDPTESEPAQSHHGSETDGQIADRHWGEILQELRVTQTGTQILTGFLLTLPFQTRFSTLSQAKVDVYLALVIVACITTVLALAPVSLHRLLFRQGVKERMVHIADIILRCTLAGVASVLVGTVLLIFSVVAGLPVALAAAGFTLIVVVGVWVAVPSLAHPRRRR